MPSVGPTTSISILSLRLGYGERRKPGIGGGGHHCGGRDLLIGVAFDRR